MKVLTVTGARPQFIKASSVSHVLRQNHKEVLVHTGQHYDYNMSGQFFDELDIPRPDYNLGISGGTHSQMTGRMMIALEEVILSERPDCVLVYGDTNSTLAAALAAVKVHVPVCHVEAGVRTHSMTNPEEINRICTDHISRVLCASSESGVINLAKEGLTGYFTGNPMYDAFLKYKDMRKPGDIELVSLRGGPVKVPGEYYYLTCHREENTQDDKPLTEILTAMENLNALTIYPVHPRNHDRALRITEAHSMKNILLSEPAGYLDNICLISNSKAVVTDSGGVQTEAFFAGIKCVTVFDFVAWPETMIDGRNTLALPDSRDILNKLALPQRINPAYQPFGDGHSAIKIVSRLEEAIA